MKLAIHEFPDPENVTITLTPACDAETLMRGLLASVDDWEARRRRDIGCPCSTSGLEVSPPEPAKRGTALRAGWLCEACAPSLAELIDRTAGPFASITIGDRPRPRTRPRPRSARRTKSVRPRPIVWVEVPETTVSTRTRTPNHQNRRSPRVLHAPRKAWCAAAIHPQRWSRTPISSEDSVAGTLHHMSTPSPRLHRIRRVVAIGKMRNERGC